MRDELLSMHKVLAVAGRPSQRSVLLDAAMELFARGGSRGTSLAAVAERSGMTAPAMTHHFGSKQGLLVAIVDELDRRDTESLGEIDGSGIERFRALGRWAHAMVADERIARLAQLRSVLATEALDPDYPAQDRFVARHRRMRDTIRAIIDAGRADGSIDAGVDASAVAAEVLATFQGAQIQWLLDPEHIDLVAVVDGYLERLAADLAPRTELREEAVR